MSPEIEAVSTSILIPALAGLIFIGSLVAFVYVISNRNKNVYRKLMVHSGSRGTNARLRAVIEADESGAALDDVSTQLKKRISKKVPVTLEEKMFRAGIFTARQKEDYVRLRTVSPMIAVAVGALVGIWLGGVDIVLLCAFAGGIFGAYLPLRILDRKEKQRSDEILYYLPLVIEQVSIGVSSSLDIGPCVQRIVAMADERDTHNPVTELLRYAQYYVKSGASFEESLSEVGRLSGSHELKHALMALSQVAKFGGEISRQLQELADSVSAQREARVEEKIKKLELAATPPVSLVFFGYLAILLTGFMLQIIDTM
jgi:Flp pilus assembly protein TadB